MNLHLSFPTVLAILSLFSLRVTHACKCMYPSIPEAFNMSDSIFIGTVTDVTKLGNETSYDPYLITLDITESWKGNNNSTIEVYTSPSSASCGYAYFLPEESGEDPVGKEFLVYTTKYEASGEEWVSGCSRTKPIGNITDDIQAEIDELNILAGGGNETAVACNGTASSSRSQVGQTVAELSSASPATSREVHIPMQWCMSFLILCAIYIL